MGTLVPHCGRHTTGIPLQVFRQSTRLLANTAAGSVVDLQSANTCLVRRVSAGPQGIDAVPCRPWYMARLLYV
jgi:hypothetical protein